MLRIVILICANTVSPPDCRPDTALDLINGPPVRGIVSCLVQGQSVVARTATIGRRKGEYVKIRCEPLDRPALAIRQ